MCVHGDTSPLVSHESSCTQSIGDSAVFVGQCGLFTFTQQKGNVEERKQGVNLMGGREDGQENEGEGSAAGVASP